LLVFLCTLLFPRFNPFAMVRYSHENAVPASRRPPDQWPFLVSVFETLSCDCRPCPLSLSHCRWVICGLVCQRVHPEFFSGRVTIIIPFRLFPPLYRSLLLSAVPPPCFHAFTDPLILLVSITMLVFSIGPIRFSRAVTQIFFPPCRSAHSPPSLFLILLVSVPYLQFLLPLIPDSLGFPVRLMIPGVPFVWVLFRFTDDRSFVLVYVLMCVF